LRWLAKSTSAELFTSYPKKSEQPFERGWTTHAVAILCPKKKWKRSTNCAVNLRHCEERSDEAIHSLCGEMDCFAEPVIGRAFA
jgi:hypothetical protein